MRSQHRATSPSNIVTVMDWLDLFEQYQDVKEFRYD
jgi:hypothetical protein